MKDNNVKEFFLSEKDLLVKYRKIFNDKDAVVVFVPLSCSLEIGAQTIIRSAFPDFYETLISNSLRGNLVEGKILPFKRDSGKYVIAIPHKYDSLEGVSKDLILKGVKKIPLLKEKLNICSINVFVKNDSEKEAKKVLFDNLNFNEIVFE